MTAPVVFGFDLSLRAPAAVALPVGWRAADWKNVRSWLFRPPAPKSDDDVRGQLERYMAIADWAASAIQEATGVRGAPGRTLAGLWIEAYAYSKNNASASRLMELGGVVRMRLFEALGIVPQTVASSSARKVLLGKVPRSDQKIAAQRALFDAGAPKYWEENICDAMVVANWALTEVGGRALILGPEANGEPSRKKAIGGRR